MPLLYANEAESTLQSGISAGATSLSIASADADEFPSPGTGESARRRWQQRGRQGHGPVFGHLDL